MSYQNRLTSPGPARDDPELGDTTRPGGLSSGDPESPNARERAGEAATAGREQAQEVMGTATDQARQVAGTAGAEARDVARTAEGQARRLASEARDELRAQAGGQMTRLAESIEDLSRQLRSMGERGDPGPATDMAGEAAHYAERMADRLRRGGPEDAVDQLRHLGRNRPGMFLVGAFGVGLVAGRVARNLNQDGSPGPARDGAAGRPPPAIGRAPTSAPYAEPASYADPVAHRAYGAPAEPGTAPVGERRWGT